MCNVIEGIKQQVSYFTSSDGSHTSAGRNPDFTGQGWTTGGGFDSQGEPSVAFESDKKFDDENTSNFEEQSEVSQNDKTRNQNDSQAAGFTDDKSNPFNSGGKRMFHYDSAQGYTAANLEKELKEKQENNKGPQSVKAPKPKMLSKSKQVVGCKY